MKIEIHAEPKPHGGMSEKTKGPKGGLELLRAVIHKLPTHDLHEGHKIFADEISRRREDDAMSKAPEEMTNAEFERYVKKVMPGHHA